MDKKELTILGSALYACEGTKARRDYRTKNGFIRSIELTNSDPKIVSAFSKFLKEILKVDWDRVRGQLFLYPDLKEPDLKKFWSEKSGISQNNFQKSIILNAKTGKFKANPNGTFKIRYSCKSDFIKLEKIIDEMWSGIKL
ncbi:MAG: hypothetical protein WC451_00490 [Patescibacteria group bacterium]